MSAFVVVMSDHKHPKYFVARKMIGHESYAVVCTSTNEYNARQIATAMNATDEARHAEERTVVALKRKRA